MSQFTAYYFRLVEPTGQWTHVNAESVKDTEGWTQDARAVFKDFQAAVSMGFKPYLDIKMMQEERFSFEQASQMIREDGIYLLDDDEKSNYEGSTLSRVYHSPIWIPPDDRLVRFLEFLPAVDQRDANSETNESITGMKIRFAVAGKKGVVYFTIMTGWYPQSVIKDLDDKEGWARYPYQALPLQVGSHAFARQRPNQISFDNCPFLEGVPCYWDISLRDGNVLYWDFVEQGESAIWTALEDRYYALKGE